MKKKSSTPGWLPFALAGSFLVALGAGWRAGWKLAGEPAKPPTPLPPAQGALSDWLSGELRI